MVSNTKSSSNINSNHEVNVTTQALPIPQENDTESVESKEIVMHALDINSGATTSFEPLKPTSTISYTNENEQVNVRLLGSPVPVILVHQPTSNQGPTAITVQPLRTFSNLPSAFSINIPLLNQPQTLFLQALAKVNESPPILTIYNRLKLKYPQLCIGSTPTDAKSEDLPAPDSLTSAPPSYSFVLRQMAARRRPRLMGTFIPSPSFVQHTPPPNYAAAFDIYVDNAMPPPPTRVVNFGFMAMPAACPECGFAGLTVVTTKITICTHLCAFILCLFCCWICAPLPYMLRSCKDVYHYCRNCRTFLGMYCPTNPDNAYS